MNQQLNPITEIIGKALFGWSWDVNREQTADAIAAILKALDEAGYVIVRKTD